MNLVSLELEGFVSPDSLVELTEISASTLLSLVMVKVNTDF